MSDTSASRDYSETIFLPKTDFPMRAGLPKREPEWLKRWEAIRLFEQLREQSKDRPQYTLHDGPPYANGHIHMGTALNKILKDIINRSHQMAGYNAHYVPGWDCHGLPIEWKVEEEFRAKGRQKDDVPGSEFRARCRSYAQEWLDIQRKEFKRLGVIGEWDNPYLTMNFQSEADICGELLKIAGTGQLYRGAKPIMWSPVEQTALAEAEVEYKDRKASQIYVRFPVSSEVHTAKGADMTGMWDVPSASVVIWTTTPWTIPANRAVSFSKNIKYGLYEITKLADVDFPLGQKVGDKLIVADDLWEKLAEASFIIASKRLREIQSETLEQIVLAHPLKDMDGADGAFDFPVPMLAGDHVTAEAGTGFVHTAPSHGEDDFNVWMENTDKLSALGIDAAVPMTLDDKGCYTDIMPERFQGLDVIRLSPAKKRGQDGKANGEVIKALVECGNLLSRKPMTLRDAHSWRSKAPVIRRATPQWFISMSKDGLREKALKAIDETTFFPDRGRNRIGAMVADRPDWLISRQRNWGVPITLIVGPNGELHTERADADAINARILKAVETHGVDGWFDTPLSELMPEGHDGWEKVTDILDVWFDSGSTHAFCLKRRDDMPDRADLYLEGSDQHRGWFQSSLLESCAVYGEAPYDGVLTHGFVVDEKGYKMSKSVGNTMSPDDISKQYGAEIMRIWVASSDWADDLKIGKEIIQTNVDAFRKIRNTLRYMIGALGDYDGADVVEYADMPALEKWVLHKLSEIEALHGPAVKGHDHKKIFAAIYNFVNLDLSSFYFDIRKDAAYCDPKAALRRRAFMTVTDIVFKRLAVWLAPIMCFTVEEVWQWRFPSENGSVHLELFPEAPAEWKNESLAAHMEVIRTFRSDVSEAIEPLRKADVIGKSLEAGIIAPANDALAKALTALEVSRQETYKDPANPDDTLADLLIISDCSLSKNAEAIEVVDLKTKSGWNKCERSWKFFKGVGEITPRDAEALKAFDAGL